MKLRFRVNQAECFRKGVNAEKSIVTIEVDPSTLDERQRNLIADRMDGIDVFPLTAPGGFVQKRMFTNENNTQNNRAQIESPGLEFPDLMKAIMDNDEEVMNEVKAWDDNVAALRSPGP